ncbi:hypothetical protein [Methylobacterium tarhaniae]|uniref:hypothetical protein n=1 Tax=Methylobacterium tarhaniae TaxID=1187852 RepID=UPI000AE52DEF|nr:hypothetical protein [Methylobacterium tarhaniae]
MSSEAVKWTDVGALAISSLGLLVAIVTIFMLYRQLKANMGQFGAALDQIRLNQETLKADHERSRRSLAISICMDWSRFVDAEITAVTRLIEEFDEEQCRSIRSLGELRVNRKHAQLLSTIFQKSAPDMKFDSEHLTGTDFVISGKNILFLRNAAIRYLNMLESSLAAWHYGVADEDIIVDQFQYLLDRSRNKTAIEKYRKTEGDVYFPAITAFMQKIQPKLSSTRDIIA